MWFFLSVFYPSHLMSNPSISMGKLPIKGIFPLILKGNDFEWLGQNTDRKNNIGFTYNIPIIVL